MTEDELGWLYFNNDPEGSPRMRAHMDWHTARENRDRTGNYGERFLAFHQQYLDAFDVFRASRGLLPVSAWDPATRIPLELAHPKKLMEERATDDPSSVNPRCATPTWATLAGGSTPDPLYGHTRLDQFASLDELGRAIDAGWHGTVHNTIGGDMKTFHSPIDPVFWRWHRWVDEVRVAWVASRARAEVAAHAEALSRLLAAAALGPTAGIMAAFVSPESAAPLAASGNLFAALSRRARGDLELVAVDAFRPTPQRLLGMRFASPISGRSLGDADASNGEAVKVEFALKSEGDLTSRHGQFRAPSDDPHHGHPLTFEGDAASTKVPPGDWVFDWVVFGANGTEFESVVTPEDQDPAKKPQRVIDGVNVGSMTFTVKQGE